MEQHTLYNKPELPEKELITTCKCGADHAYDIRYQRMTPHKKLAQFRRQSTAPEFT